MKSSIDFLIKQLSPYLCFPLGESAGYNLQDVFDKAEEMHKDEIMTAFIDGYEYREMCETRPNKFSSTKPVDYYNETFKDMPLK